MLTLVDHFTRECLLLYSDRTLSREKEAAELERIMKNVECPHFDLDNGSQSSNRCMGVGHEIRCGS